jgi:molybdopterin/thiamine biosynthesis adenylyltransferase/molybdopterin synthase catalytic subunit/rhodanese-related sulfurtransferase
MRAFSFSEAPLDPDGCRDALADPSCGGYASFEGWVRDHNDGRRVRRLEYEAFEALAVKEGERIVAAAIERYGVQRAACIHRVGDLGIGDLAVWVGASAEHRGEAFAACRYIIDEVKHRLPIWKKEHYEDGDSGWVNCERCAEAPDHDAPHAREHELAREQGHSHPHDHASDGGQRDFAHDYSRQVALPDVGTSGQAKLRAASVLVIGAGGLGVPVLQYLTAAGVGRITVMDGDVVESSNLHRQPLYEAADIGRQKAVVAAERMVRMNRELACEAIAERADPGNLEPLVARHDLVVECTDNLRSKFLVNDAVLRAGKPAVFASVYQYEGQIQAWLPEPDWPCLRCLWPEAPRDGLVGNCAEAGVLGPVPGTVGTMQAMLALRILLGIEPTPARGLVVVDLLSLATRHIRAARDPACNHSAPGPLTGGHETPIEVEFSSLSDARSAGYKLVDVRETWELVQDPPGLDTGQHLPLSELLAGRCSFPAEGRHLVICAHGVRSYSLAEHLRERGRVDVYSMRGGIAALMR